MGLTELVAALKVDLGRNPKEAEVMHVWRRYRPLLGRPAPPGFAARLAARYDQ